MTTQLDVLTNRRGDLLRRLRNRSLVGDESRFPLSLPLHDLYPGVEGRVGADLVSTDGYDGSGGGP